MVTPLVFAAFAAMAPSAVADGAPADVTVAQIVAAPGRWEGRRVRVEGLAAREFENSRLFGSYEDYCALGEPGAHRQGLQVRWDDAKLRARRFRRMAVVEGVFHNPPLSSEAPDGTVTITIGAGPSLTDWRLVRWTSAQLTRCGDPRE